MNEHNEFVHALQEHSKDDELRFESQRKETNDIKEMLNVMSIDIKSLLESREEIITTKKVIWGIVVFFAAIGGLVLTMLQIKDYFHK